MKTFEMIRRKDESGVSGTGKVLEGVIFTSGEVVVCWQTSWHSIGVYKNYDEFLSVHVTSHPTNKTKIVFKDGTVEEH